MKQLKLYRRT